MKARAIGLMAFLSALAVPALSMAQTPTPTPSPELKKWQECAAKVRKDYPVPPGNVNAQNQMIKDQCGERPSK